MNNYFIRKIKPEEYHLLSDFLYEAIFQIDENNLLPKNIVDLPELSKYFSEFGKEDDHCLVAKVNGNIVGAVWVRLLIGEAKGYGYVDDNTPELSISLYKEYRGLGIGSTLMKGMLVMLRDIGYKQISLSVQKANYAANIYIRLGFEVLVESEDEYVMVYRF